MIKLDTKRLDGFKQYQKESKMDYIMINELKPYHLYRIHARNSRYGIYIPKEYSFLIRRNKFNDWFLFEEYHWDTGAPFGTVRPLKELEQTPFRQEDLEQGPWETNGVKLYGYLKSAEIAKYLRTKTEEYENE